MKCYKQTKSDKNIVHNKSKKKPEKSDPKTTIVVKANAFKTFVDAIAICNTEAIINISSNLEAHLVDTANVMMTRVTCDHERAEGEPQIIPKIGVNIPVLKKVLSYANDCNITIEVTEAVMKLSYGRFTSKIPVCDITTIRKEPNAPTIVLPTKIEFPGKYLNEVCKIGGTSGRIIFCVKDKVVFATIEDGDISTSEVVGTIDKKSYSRSIFSNNYMLDISKMVKDTSCMVEFGIDHPIRVTAEKNDCKMEFLLAPRIEAD